MKISKQESNFEIEISAEEITSLSGLLKNDNAMELVSGILRYFQIQTERERLEEGFKIEKELTKIESEPEQIRNIHAPSAEQEAVIDPGYFVGVPSNGS